MQVFFAFTTRMYYDTDLLAPTSRVQWVSSAERLNKFVQLEERLRTKNLIRHGLIDMMT